MSEIGLEPGDTFTFAKVVGDEDVSQFAAVTGDFARQHMDEEFMRMTEFGGRIAHGVLILGLASTAATLAVEASGHRALSYGYDHVRFVAPVRLGSTVTITYEITEVDESSARTRAHATATMQDGTVCMVADHILKFVGMP